MVKIRAHVFISGIVQGVFFRQKTKQQAESQSVTGWIKNLPDGRVEAIFEGEAEAVNRLVDFSKKGPINAQVTDFDLKWEKYKGEFRNFEIIF